MKLLKKKKKTRRLYDFFVVKPPSRCVTTAGEKIDKPRAVNNKTISRLRKKRLEAIRWPLRRLRVQNVKRLTAVVRRQTSSRRFSDRPRGSATSHVDVCHFGRTRVDVAVFVGFRNRRRTVIGLASTAVIAKVTCSTNRVGKYPVARDFWRPAPATPARR